MALELTYMYKGIIANYWRINSLKYDDITDIAIVDLWLYANEQAKNDDLSNNKLTRKVITVKGVKDIEIPEGLTEIVGNPRDLLKTMLYQKIKEPILDEEGNDTNLFSEATNC